MSKCNYCIHFVNYNVCVRWKNITVYIADCTFYFIRKSMENHRTAVLWLQYMKMVDIIRKFIKAERTGNWELHLQSVRNMLPFFAAAGHHLYAKSAYIYLQRMHSLKKDHPDVYRSFRNGLHVVRRSDR